MRGNYSHLYLTNFKKDMLYQITLESKSRKETNSAIMLHMDDQATVISNLASACSGEEIGREWDLQYNARSITLRFNLLSNKREFLKIFHACWSNWFLVDEQKIED